MRIILISLLSLLFLMPGYLYADEDSEFRDEILGEESGKLIAGDHSEYQPAAAKEECRGALYNKWEAHSKEKGFDNDQAAMDNFVAGCKKNNKKINK